MEGSKTQNGKKTPIDSFLKTNSSISEAIRAFDYYGQPISMNDNNKQTHQTVFGGFITIIVSVSFFSFFMQSMIGYDQFYKKDTVSTTSQRFDISRPLPAEPLYDPVTKSNRFDMMFYMNNDTFNNFDNQYGFFVFHMYTNMKD